MKKFVYALCCLTFAAGIAAAQTCKIGILQAQAALETTKDGQAAKVDLDKRLGPKVSELQKRESDLRDLQDKINRGGNTMKQEALDSLKKEFDQKTKTFNRDKQDFEDEAQAAENKVLGELSEKLKKVIDKFRQDGGYCLILNVSDPNTPVVAFADEIDVTQAVIDAYDKTQSSAPAKAVAPVKPATGPAVTAPRPPAAPPAAAPKPPASPANK